MALRLGVAAAAGIIVKGHTNLSIISVANDITLGSVNLITLDLITSVSVVTLWRTFILTHDS